LVRCTVAAIASFKRGCGLRKLEDEGIVLREAESVTVDGGDVTLVSVVVREFDFLGGEAEVEGVGSGGGVRARFGTGNSRGA
jgi:hypothetical protein